MNKLFRIGLPVLLVLTAAGCSQAATTPTPKPELVLTSAAQTVAVQLTSNAAKQPSSTPLPPTATLTNTPAVSPTSAATVAPTNTIAPTSGAAQQPVSACDGAKFEADVTIPDGSNIAAGSNFTKTWRLRNSGTCTWNTNYSLVFVSGDKMDSSNRVNLTREVKPGDVIELSVGFTAPSNNGNYASYWKMSNASGVLFGEAPNNAPFWVKITVGTGGTSVSGSTTPTATKTTSGYPAAITNTPTRTPTTSGTSAVPSAKTATPTTKP